MRKKAYLLIFLLLTSLLLPSCIRLSGNHVSIYGVDNIEDFTFSNVKFDIDTLTYQLLTRAEDTVEWRDFIVEGGTAPRYCLDIKEGYEAIEDDILSLNTLDDQSVIYTVAFLNDDTVYGICNVYGSTIGFLSGGGNYGEEEIAYSVYFQYDNETDTMETLCTIDNATMVAFSGDYLVYWKNKAFYSYCLTDDSETKLCDHLAYDSGLRHQSVTTVYFNDNYVILEMKKAGAFNVDTYYNYLYEYGGELTEFKLEE